METKCAKCKKEMGELPFLRHEDQAPVCPACLVKENQFNSGYLLRLLETGKKNPNALRSLIESFSVEGGGYCNQHERVSYISNEKDRSGRVREDTVIQSISKVEWIILYENQTYCIACFMRRQPAAANRLIEFLSEKLADTLADTMPVQIPVYLKNAKQVN